jgi:ABC-type antimicrobial peptide transport system permease subunit
MDEKSTTKKEKNAYLFIAGIFLSLAGLFIGFGVGFLTNNVPGGVFLGLGLGFMAFSAAIFLKK